MYPGEQAKSRVVEWTQRDDAWGWYPTQINRQHNDSL